MEAYLLREPLRLMVPGSGLSPLGFWVAQHTLLPLLTSCTAQPSALGATE